MDNEKIKVLLIEDNPGDARLIRELLAEVEGAPFDLYHTDRLSAGLERLVRGDIDVILLDLSLPDSKGLDSLGKLHAQAPKVPIVVLSGLSDEAVAVKAVQEGAQDYLVKGSIDGGLLVRSLRYAIERHRLRVELRESESRYRLLADNVADIVWTADAEARITYVSPSIKRLLGYTVDEAMKLKIGDILTADSLEQARRFVKGQMNMRAWGMHYPPASMTLEHVRKDGSTVWAEVMLSFMQSRDGSIIGIMGATRDITEHRVAEEALRESETRFRTVFEGTKVGIALIDMFGKPLNINPAFQRMFGYTFEEFRKLTNLEYLHPEDAMVDAKLYLEMSKGKLDHYTVDKRYIRKDGGVIWGRQHLSVNRGAEGKPRYFIAMVEDITERRMMEEELRRLSDAVRMSSDSITITDLEGNVIDANEATLKLQGAKSKAELLGMKPYEVIVPEEQESALSDLAKVVEGGSVRDIQYHVLTRDGRRILVETSASLMRGANGEPMGVVAVSRDITERKRMEDALRASEERLRLYFESVSDVIYSIDTEFRVISVSPSVEKLLGYKPEELIGKLIQELNLLTPESMERAVSDVMRVLGGEQLTSIEYEFIAKDGKSRFGDISGAPVFSPEGKVVAIVCVAKDITERKKADEALRESERRLRDAMVLGNSGYWEFDIVMQKLIWSEQTFKLFGRDPSLGAPSVEEEAAYYPPEQVVKLREYAQRAIEKRESIEYDFVVTLPSGKSAYMMGFMRPVNDAIGKVVKLFGVFYDITERKRMEEEISLLSDAVKMSKDSIVITDLEGRIIEANDATLKMHGMDNREDLVGRPALELIVPQDHEMLTEKMAKGMVLEGLACLEYHCIKNDGSICLCEATVSEVKDKNGEHTGYMAVVRDITERKRVDEALRRLSDAVKMSKESIFVSDLEGKVLDANEAAMRMFGVDDISDLIGKGVAELIAVEDQGKALGNMGKAIEKGEVNPVEYYFTRKDGSKVLAEISASTLKGDNGEPVGFVAVARDITERKRMEEALRQREQGYLLLLESTFEGMIVVDAETMKVVFGNRRASKMFGFDPILGDGIGLNILDLIHPEDREVVVRGVVEDLQTLERRKKYEVRVKTKDGREIWVDALATRIEFQGRLAILLSMKDVTERKRVEEERRRLEEQIQLAGRLAAVGELAAGVAHELNNPIAAIRGFAQLLNGRKDVDETTKKDLGTIYKEAQRASKITQNLLTFARKHDPAKRLISMNEAVEKTLELRAHQMTMNNIELVLKLDAEIPETMADSHQMQQVFLNIINNAEQAMVEAHGKGRLEVKTEKAGGLIRITFSDDGPGIPEENLERIFDPFFTTKEVGKGTGLGLSICYGLVEAHGGHIHVRSKLGEGATFVVEIPLVSEDSSSIKARILNPRSRGMR